MSPVGKENWTLTKSNLEENLLFSGSNVNKQRKCDDWSPLFVAAMLGRVEVTNKRL